MDEAQAGQPPRPPQPSAACRAATQQAPLPPPEADAALIDQDLEYVVLNKEEAFCYKIPNRTPLGHKADSWTNCIWTGRLQVACQGRNCVIKLIDAHTGELFARCPMQENYEAAVEPTVDSSRYFALRLDDGRGHHAFVGLGFESRGDAFDLKCCLSDFAGRLKAEEAMKEQDDLPKKNLQLKEGEKILVELPGMSHKKKTRSRQETAGDVATTSASLSFVLPPPPPSCSRNPVDQRPALRPRSPEAATANLQTPTEQPHALSENGDFEFSDFQSA
eukprot:GHVT01055550.1.p1 GENE.GHVT01055550.1~~GHVT01055550.1.p1  ORF type:complete len:276 (+),score=69.69 GHVT01055550.1:190-1017(+)